jgi:hypothetical protein
LRIEKADLEAAASFPDRKLDCVQRIETAATGSVCRKVDVVYELQRIQIT